ncbi:MAG: portal protein [Gemmatimonadales bacterium]|nr:MAG: portal protein [Gemmatimonadales bacterium]
MAELDILQDLGLILLAATACVLVARLARVPAIVAYILAGLLLGPILGAVEVTDTVHLISEVGIALLLFLVGLELSLEKIRDVGKVAVVAGLGQVVFTAGGGIALCLLLGFDVLQSVFIATALTFSSTVVVVKLLDQKGDLESVYGRIAVGIFLVQDIVVVAALTVLSGLGRTDGTELGEIAMSLALAFGGMGLILLVAAIAARWVLPPTFRWISRSPESLFIWALTWCFLLVLGAELMEVSIEIGAFLAGIALAQLPYHGDLRRRVHPLMNFFIAVFFVSLGIQMEFGDAAGMWLPAVVLSLFVLIGNPFIFMLIITRMKYDEKTAFFTSVTVAQISEFSFILAALGLATGVIGEEVLSLIGVVGLVTIGISAYMILYNGPLYRVVRGLGVLKIFQAAPPEEGGPDEADNGARDHVIVVGMNDMGRRIVELLHEAGVATVAVDTDPEKLDGLPCTTVLGNSEYSSVLDEARLDRAQLLVSALQIEDTNRTLAFTCQQRGIPCALHAFDHSMTDILDELDVAFLLDSREAGLERMVDSLRKGEVLPG